MVSGGQSSVARNSLYRTQIRYESAQEALRVGARRSRFEACGWEWKINSHQSIYFIAKPDVLCIVYASMQVQLLCQSPVVMRPSMPL